MSNPWVHCPGLPPGPAAALAALHLDEPRLDILARIPEADWPALLDYCDASRLTLALRDRARSSMPSSACDRVERDALKNRIRVAGIEELHRSLYERLGSAGIEFLALKGLTHAALFDPESAPLRMQYDVDLYLPRAEAERAQHHLCAVGWEPLEGMEAFPTDHLPALIRRTGWQWRGDFFDTEIPLSVELHFQFWNDRLERLPASGVDAFWDRRTTRPIGGVAMGMLHPPDALAYAALHMLKHVLRGSVNPFHIFEIAAMLDRLAADDAFWTEWRSLHSPDLRRLEAVGYRLSQAWFGGRAPQAVDDEIARLPAATARWFHEFAVSPAVREFHPNKDELWLHLSLLRSRRDAWSVARRRLLPGNLPPMAANAHLPDSERTWRRRAGHWMRTLQYVGKRFRHHAISLPQTAISGLRWWRGR